MESLSIEALIAWLVILIIVSAYFSGSETGMMRVNRFRLKSIINSKSKRRKAAKRVKALIKRPDRLLGLILIGNNFVNILAASIATVIAVRYLRTEVCRPRIQCHSTHVGRTKW